MESYSDEELDRPIWETARNASDFFLICSWASAQKKSKDIEYYLCRQMGWHYVEAVEGRGDSHDDDGTYYELKTSTTNDDHLLNIRQIRLWQDVDYYVCSYIDEFDIANSWCFKLTKIDSDASPML